MIPFGRPHGPAVPDRVTPSLIMINDLPQCPGRDITIRKEIDRNGTWPARTRVDDVDVGQFADRLSSTVRPLRLGVPTIRGIWFRT